MVKRSRLLNHITLVTLALLIMAGGYFFYDKYGNVSYDPMQAIPSDAAVFIRFGGPGKTMRALPDRNEIWMELAGTQRAGWFLSQLAFADSSLVAMGYGALMEEEEIYLVLNGDSGAIGWCLLFRWPYGARESHIDQLVNAMAGKELQKTAVDFAGARGHMLHDSSEVYCYTMVRGGLCAVGSTQTTMEKVVLRMDNKTTLPRKEEFERVALTAGKKVDANVYINFERLPLALGKLFSPAFTADRPVIPNFGSWSEVDLIIKNNELLLNGYTEAVDSLHQFLGLFRSHQPPKIAVTRILPYNTSLLVSFGFDDFNTFYHDYALHMEKTASFPGRSDQLQQLNKRYGPNTEKFMTSWVGNEIALCMINPHLPDTRENSFMAIHARDIEMALRQLGELSSSQYSGSYRGYDIRRVNIPDFIPLVFGRIFSEIVNNYYTRVEDYIVFANSSRSIENFINIFQSGKTLEQNENFKGFSNNVTRESNIFCYFNVRNSAGRLPELLSEPLADFAAGNPEVLRNFEAIAVQFKTLNNMFFTSAYFRHNPSYVKEDLSVWKAYLDAPVHGEPYFVTDHRTNNLKIVAFDTLNNMYLIDHNGNINWKLNIGEKVISDVQTVDYYKNGKIQYLFNTAERIYLIDLLGRDVEAYPVELKMKATNGLAVFDYDNNLDYRVMLALEDNRVYNFDIRGRVVDGWTRPLSKARVNTPVQHLRTGGRDYIVIADEEGNIKITDRRGDPRINLKERFVNGNGSAFYVNQTNSKGILLTTDNEGNLTYINSNGRIERTDFGSYSPDHYFLYEDFDNRNGKDFIYLDGNRLTVFDRFKNVIFFREFGNDIRSSPVIIPVSAREKLIGVVSEAERKIYLFDREGQLISTPEHIGKTRMLIGSLKRDGQLNMIVGAGNTIYNYYFR